MAPPLYRQSKLKDAFVILGACLDSRTTNRPGARLAPQAIRIASRMLCEIKSTRKIFDIGDVSYEGDQDDADNNLQQAIRVIAGNKAVPITLGGDHSITLPILTELYSVYKQPINLIHFDAHPDTWPDNWGVTHGHGNFLFHAMEDGYVSKNVMIVGLRSSMGQDIHEYTMKRAYMNFAEDIHLGGERVLETIADRACAWAQQAPTYVTLDIDALDPAFAPGTGTPEIGGLASWQIRYILKRLIAKRSQFVGMDVVEVSPPYDHAGITSLAAAQFIVDFIEATNIR